MNIVILDIFLLILNGQLVKSLHIYHSNTEKSTKIKFFFDCRAFISCSQRISVAL